jgi:hypothetical protein
MALSLTRAAFGGTFPRPRARFATLLILPAFLLPAFSAALAQSSTTTVSGTTIFGFITGTATATVDTGPNDCEPGERTGVLLLQFPGGTCQTYLGLTVSCQNQNNFVAPGVQQLTGSYTGYGGTDKNGAQCTVPGSGGSGSVTVPQGATTTSVQSPSGPIQSGQTVSLPITIVGPQQNSFAPGPTGLATLYFDGQALASQQVQTTGGVATSTATLTASSKGVPPGQYQVVVKYAGDAVYLPSTSSAVPITIEAAQLSTSTVLTVSPNPLVAGEAATLGITVTKTGNVPPTGTVTILANGAKVDTATVTNGAATVAAPTTGLPPGSYSVIALYGGDQFNLPSTSSPVAVSIVATSPTTTTVTVTPNSLVEGQTTQITATVKQQIGNLVPTGTVALTANGAPIATLPLKNGTATLAASTAGIAPGGYNVVAKYSGSSTSQPSTSLAANVQIHKPATVNVTASPNPVTQGNVTTLAATVLDGNGNPVTSGTVNFSYSGNALGSASLGTGGTAQLPIATNGFAPGTYLISATYTGSQTIPPATGTVTLVVNAP